MKSDATDDSLPPVQGGIKLYRPACGSFEESVALAQTWSSLFDIHNILVDQFKEHRVTFRSRETGEPVEPPEGMRRTGEVCVEFYGKDHRDPLWVDTYVVTICGNAVGFTNALP